MEESEVIVRAADNIADQVAQIEERTLTELMRVRGFEHYTQMQNAGYRAVHERHGNGNAYWVICKDVDRKRIPQIVIASDQM